jgi:hypothetical protein
VEKWRGFGDAGVQVLVRGFEKATDRSGRLHRKFDRKTPQWLRRRLPDPPTDRGAETRSRIASLLWSMGSEARSAGPAMIPFAEEEEDVSVLQSIVGYFSTGEDNSVLNTMTPGERKKLAPLFVRILKDPSLAQLHHNASIGCKFFREDAELLAPVLIGALTNSSDYVRVYAAEALNCIAPTAGKQAGAMGVLLESIDSRNNDVARQAVRALEHPGVELETAVAALVKCLQSTNTEVACQAVWTLESAPQEFHHFAEVIVPDLTKASRRKDNIGGYAKVALLRWEKNASE